MRMRLAEGRDWARLFAWRNDPDAQVASGNQAPVPLADHVAWLDKVLGQKKGYEQVRLFVFHDGARSCYVGTGRLDRKGKAVTVSLAVDSHQRGQGYAQQMIDLLVVQARDLWPEAEQMVALIRPLNYASLRAFANAGFKLAGKLDAEMLQLVRPLDVGAQ